jgi:hypothetical protein
MGTYLIIPRLEKNTKKMNLQKCIHLSFFIHPLTQKLINEKHPTKESSTF